jgi:hypothetical protein
MYTLCVLEVVSHDRGPNRLQRGIKTPTSSLQDRDDYVGEGKI